MYGLFLLVYMIRGSQRDHSLSTKKTTPAPPVMIASLRRTRPSEVTGVLCSYQLVCRFYDGNSRTSATLPD